MASKPAIRDSSITEQMLNPHLRRRLRGGGSSYASLTGTTTGGVIASYEHSTSQTMTIEAWESDGLALAADTPLVANAAVTDTDPWTYEGDGSVVTVTLTSTISMDCSLGGCVVALMAGGRDVASLVTGAGALTWPVQIATTLPVTMHIRACALMGASGVLTVADVAVQVSS